MVLTVTQGSASTGVSVPYSNPTHIKTRIPLSFFKPAPPQKENYDDPTRNYGFNIAVRLGNSNQENHFHPSHSILNPLREEGFDLSQIPTKFDQAIHIDGNYFHRIPHPTVSDLHKVDHKQSQKSLLLDAIIIGMNKNINEERYRYTIFDPLNLVLSHARARPGSPNKIELSYQDSQGTKQSIEKTSQTKICTNMAMNLCFLVGLKIQ